MVSGRDWGSVAFSCVLIRTINIKGFSFRATLRAYLSDLFAEDPSNEFSNVVFAFYVFE